MSDARVRSVAPQGSLNCMMMIEIDSALKIVKGHVSKVDLPLIDVIRIQTGDPFKILVGTMLSARTTDEVTANACEQLFAVAQTPATIVRLSNKRIEKLIYPVAFYRTKAAHLSQLCQMLVDSFDAQVPKNIYDLLKLPGVGRKTANLVVAQTGTQDGICVDVHVHRIVNRWGYVRTDSPGTTEMRLREKLPKRHWASVNRLLVALGQHTCRPISPKCSECPLESMCPKIGVNQSR